MKVKTAIGSKLVRDGHTYINLLTNDPESYAMTLDTLKEWSADPRMKFDIGDFRVVSDNINDQFTEGMI